MRLGSWKSGTGVCRITCGLCAGNPNRVIDIRYSVIPNELAPLWSIELDPAARRDEHANYLVHREAGSNRAALMWRMLSGN